MSHETYERRPSGWRYLFVGLLAFFFAAVIFVLGLMTGGGSFLFDRIMTGLGLAQVEQAPPDFVSGDAIVQQIRQISRLETTTYTVERVIEAKQSEPGWPDWLRGDRLLFIANGTVVAGIDLEQVGPEDVVVSPDHTAVTVTLPAVQVFNVNSMLDNSRSRVYDRQQGILAPSNVDLESQARQVAEGEILRAACEGKILEHATEDAQRAVEKLLQLLDMQVTVQSSAVPQCPEGIMND